MADYCKSCTTSSGPKTNNEKNYRDAGMDGPAEEGWEGGNNYGNQPFLLVN